MIFFLVGVALGCAPGGGVDWSRVLSLGQPLDQTTAERGLKQALKIGTDRTTSTLSQSGGFAQNVRLRIGLPAELDSLASALKTVGLGAQVNSFEDKMNEAAERASAKASPIFASAIASFSIEDALHILSGPDTAATTLLKDRTYSSLERELEPVVVSSMESVGLYQIYRELVARYDAIPFSRLPALDIETYITKETLEAIFTELGAEERRIREDPAARSTSLLRRVFGAPMVPAEQSSS